MSLVATNAVGVRRTSVGGLLDSISHVLSVVQDRHAARMGGMRGAIRVRSSTISALHMTGPTDHDVAFQFVEAGCNSLRISRNKAVRAVMGRDASVIAHTSF